MRDAGVQVHDAPPDAVFGGGVLWSSFGAWLTRELARRNPSLDSDA